MKRRILMVSAMILLLGSQVQMYAQKKGGPDHKRPGMEMREGRRPGGPMKAISQGDIARLQDFYWKKYRVKLSKKEAEKILIVQVRDRGRHISHMLRHLQRVSDQCVRRVLKDLQEDRKIEKLSQTRTILSILAEFF